MKFVLAILTLCVAPFVGAYKAIREELARPVIVHPSLASQCKEAARLYFAPLTGAIQETRKQFKQLVNRKT